MVIESEQRQTDWGFAYLKQLVKTLSLSQAYEIKDFITDYIVDIERANAGLKPIKR